MYLNVPYQWSTARCDVWSVTQSLAPSQLGGLRGKPGVHMVRNFYTLECNLSAQVTVTGLLCKSTGQILPGSCHSMHIKDKRFTYECFM